MKILLTGAAGQLGKALTTSLAAVGQIDALSRAQLDLADTNALRRCVRDRRPDLIINTAAYTAVDNAESDMQQAMQINATAPEILAQEAMALDIPLIHFSTDYVFDGSGSVPRDEQAPLAPLNVYGVSKAAGEAAIAAHSDAYWIFRTSWLYDSHGRNFLTTIMRLAQEKPALQVVDDQWGAPTWTGTIAAALWQILQTRKTTDLLAYLRHSSGIYHLSAAGATNWNTFARTIVRILNQSGVKLALDEEAIEPVSSATYAAPARRPANSRLNCQKFEDTFGITLPPWETALAECMAGLSATPREQGEQG